MYLLHIYYLQSTVASLEYTFQNKEFLLYFVYPSSFSMDCSNSGVQRKTQWKRKANKLLC